METAVSSLLALLSLFFNLLLPSPSSSAEPTEEAPPEVQLPAVIPQASGDDLLIGDLLSLDLPTGPSAAYNAPSGVCACLLARLLLQSVCVAGTWLVLRIFFQVAWEISTSSLETWVGCR